MRLAGTTSPLPRSLPGWNRTSGLRFPKPAGWPSPPRAEVNGSTPGGTRTRAFPVESRASSPLDHGGMKEVGGPGIEPGPARYQRAVPPRTPASDESSGSRTRTCASRLTVARLAARPHRNECEAEGEGVEPPRPESPPVFETGYRADGSPSERWLRQASNLHRAE
jgi:hypothetical protein